MKIKFDLEPGKRVRGYGLVNEYGEFFFTPEQKGSKPGNLRLIKSCEGYSLYESKHTFQIKVNIPKKEEVFEMMRSFTNSFTKAIVDLKQYIV